jgi:hypothetical protein
VKGTSDLLASLHVGKMAIYGQKLAVTAKLEKLQRQKKMGALGTNIPEPSESMANWLRGRKPQNEQHINNEENNYSKAWGIGRVPSEAYE